MSSEAEGVELLDAFCFRPCLGNHLGRQAADGGGVAAREVEGVADPGGDGLVYQLGRDSQVRPNREQEPGSLVQPLVVLLHDEGGEDIGTDGLLHGRAVGIGQIGLPLEPFV